ncbi:MAG TPA: hypothetical protein PLZ08_02150 [Bacillota bacterium]|jgi:chemotaxis protein CheY-P-specific phosphatase CheC|nr:hypothetical protein [Bacillota bacterium]HOL09067.1 hypothetical protein [Bacillota bacterium]HPO96742.1 hypothetical protein [Bacillota bacterium]
MTNLAIEHSHNSNNEAIFLPFSQIEQLYNIAQNGAAKSISSMQQFLGINVDIHLNCLSFLSLPILIDRINLYYRNHLGFHLRFSGEITGEIYTFFGEKDATILIEKMLGHHRRFKYPRRFNRLEISVLAELVNVLSNSFWRALTDKTAINWTISPPTQITNLERSLFYSAKIYPVDQFLVHFEYLIPDLDVRIQFIVLPTQKTLKKIFTKLAVLERTKNLAVDNFVS